MLHLDMKILRRESEMCELWLLGLLCNKLFSAESKQKLGDCCLQQLLTVSNMFMPSLNFTIIIEILQIGILFFHILLVYYSTKEKICGALGASY